MPAIFTEADREELRRRMFDAGWDLIVEKGVRSCAWRTCEPGRIAKGTFYSFFPSKEEFAYSIVKANRRAVMDLFEELCEQEGGRLGRDAMRTWLRSLWYSDRNIYRYATAEDFAYLSRRWPDEHSFDPEVDRVTMGRIMERLEACVPMRTGAWWRTSRRASRSCCSTGASCTRRPSTPPSTRHRSHLRRAVRPEG